MNRAGLTRRQFSLSGMLGYTSVFAVLVSIPTWCLRSGGDLAWIAFVSLVCLIGMTGWVGYGLWCLLGRRKMIMIGVICLAATDRLSALV